METIKNVLIVLPTFICMIGLIWWVRSLLAKQIGRVFSLPYKNFRRSLPNTLYVWHGKSGHLSGKTANGFRFKGLLKIEVFVDGLLVSTLGQALWLPFAQYKFTVTKQLLQRSSISTDNIPVRPTPMLFGFDYFYSTTALSIFLPQSGCEEILRLQNNIR